MANILVLGVKIPFTRGGQEVLVESLIFELIKRGHEVDKVALPFSPLPKENILTQAALWRTFDLTAFGDKKVDLVIATKFPTYYVKHPRKSLWLVHQHRALYDLYGTRYSDFSDDPRDEALRRMLVEGDEKVISECSYRAGISRNVVKRLEHYNGLQAEVLYPPLPLAGRYINKEAQHYILYVGRLCSIKRIDLMIKALPMIHNFISFKVAGAPDEDGIMEYFKNEIDKHHLWDRIEFLGKVGDPELLDLYAKTLGVYYAPYNEDYGYVTLEAFASGKPVVTCNDSGGVLEFVKHEQNGLIAEPNSEAISKAVNQLVEDGNWAKSMGEAGRRLVEEEGLEREDAWERIIESLLSPLQEQKLVAHG